jgi:DNA-binding transcriptional LysR family regulator
MTSAVMCFEHHRCSTLVQVNGLQMDLRRLGHFSVLADELSFRVASSRLHLTQPALTRSIASLERDLGVRLFDRDKRHVALTPEGAALLDRARALLRDADALAPGRQRSAART